MSNKGVIYTGGRKHGDGRKGYPCLGTVEAPSPGMRGPERGHCPNQEAEGAAL